MIIDGKELAKKIKEKLKTKIQSSGITPCLAVVLIGENPASKVYVNMKEISCKEVGITSEKYNFDDTLSQEKLLELINKLNNDPNVHGILVQLPLPKQIDEKKVIRSINPLKDVDGFHPVNMGALFTGISGMKDMVPCTPKGIIKLIESTGMDITGKNAVVIGRSNIVGTPTAKLLLDKNATVTTCHSRTKDLASYTKNADILVAAVGKPKLITKDMVKEGAIVIDVGINRVDDAAKPKGYRLVGDVDFDSVKEIASISPVPGGVGPMTIACLMENTCIAAGIKLD